MGHYQKLLLRGSPQSLEHLTSLLAEAKQRGGMGTGTTLIYALRQWEQGWKFMSRSQCQELCQQASWPNS